MPARIRVIVAAPPSPLRSRASAYLDGDADLDVAAVGTCDGAVKACASRPPDVVLVARELPPDGALAAVERITAAAPSVRILLWSDATDGPRAVAAIRSGTRGVIDQSCTPQGLIRCVKRVAAGQISLPRHLVEVVVDEFQNTGRGDRGRLDVAALTRREHEILALIGDGHTNRAIATQLGISPLTAKHHVHNLLTKLSAPSRAAAAAIYGSATRDRAITN